MIDAYQVRRSISEGSHRFISEHPGVLHIPIDDAPDLTSGLPRNALPEALSKGPREAWADMDIDTEPLAVPFDKMNKGLNELRAIVRERRSSTDLIRVVAAPPLRNGPFQQQLNHLWEGMRPHPYDDEQLAAAIMSLSRFYPTLGVFPLEEGLGPDRVAHELLDCPLEIEMGLIGGGSTRACVSTFSLWSAMTTEGRAFARPEAELSSGTIAAALNRFGGRTIGLFDPSALLNLFTTEVVPWQVAVKRPLIAFWPSHIDSLGRP